jgi:hypothetical protein
MFMNNFKLFFLLLATVLAVSCSKDDPVEEPKKPDTPVTPVTPDNPVTPDKPDDQSSGLSALHVDGRFIVNAEGVRVNLHGFAQTYSPWFNERGTKWSNYDVAGCLAYNKGIIDGILNAGWKMTFVRQHMDPYWSNDPAIRSTISDADWKGEADIRAFNYERFKKYLDEVFVPMAEYAISKGLYVVMRPPGVCPEKIYMGGDYHQYLRKVWACVVQHPKLKNNGAILFELCNEPIQICDKNGNAVNNWDGSTFDKRGQLMTEFMQDLVDMIRLYGCNNILLIPGLHYQMLYSTFGKYPVKGDNIGYAVHCYPGWYNSGYDKEVDVVYDNFKSGWNNEIKPVADMAPVVVTEMDWAPEKYNSSWGKAITGQAGGNGFGANFMRICDETHNVSWLLFTDGNLLAQYDDTAPDGNTFLTDPEACPRPVFRKYQIYATKEYSDMINQPNY